ncbi:MAG TPA: phosphopantetheine-binding protein [Ruminococcus sp.]|nr:acyl carrier protein [Ruminococcus sp.]HRU97889.1 phosphopantetheine-binding protein [Ruminococcus sp.]
MENEIRNNVREMLQELWKETLELEDIPKEEDNFFDLGGNSYKAFFLVENLPEEYKDKVELTDFYDCETFGEMVDIITGKILN